ncbi:MAG: MFS transporter [Treponema sp.]|jgi:PPP family 3-phenylpropionic acid transporter|nr:MFS transporter [Treponema sp.]
MINTGSENRFIPVYLFSFCVYGVIAPYFPIMVRNLGYSPVWIGILFGVYEGSGIAGPFAFGFWADRKGKYRFPLIISCVLPALATIPLVLLVHPVISAVLMALMAFGLKSTVSLMDAVTTIQIGQTGNYGKIRVWTTLGFVLTILFLQWTPVIKPLNAFNVAFWITIFSVVAIGPISLLPGSFLRSNPELNNASLKRHPATGNGQMKLDFSFISLYFVIGFIIIFFSRFSMAAIYTFFPLYMTEIIQWNAVGLMFAIASITEIPFMFFSASLIRRFGPLPLLAVSVLAVCARLVILAVFPYKPFIIAAQLLHSLCFGIFHPAAISFISGVFPPEKRGMGMSVYLSLGVGLPALLGNIAGGAITEVFGYRFLFAIYAAIAGTAAFLYWVLRSRLTTHGK